MTQTTEIRKQIETAERSFVYLYNAGLAEELAALYTDDAQILPDNMEPVTGRSNIVALFEGFLKEAPTIALVTTEVEQAGSEMAFEVGTYTLFDVKGAQAEKGNYIVIWRLSGDRWKLHRDIFNTSHPPAKPADPPTGP